MQNLSNAPLGRERGISRLTVTRKRTPLHAHAQGGHCDCNISPTAALREVPAEASVR